MTLHVRKKTKLNETYHDEYEDIGKPKNSLHKRPIRDWTKTYLSHLNEVEEFDDFYN